MSQLEKRELDMGDRIQGLTQSGQHKDKIIQRLSVAKITFSAHSISRDVRE